MKKIIRLPLIHVIAWGRMNEIKSVNDDLYASHELCDFAIENVMDKVSERFSEWVENYNDLLTDDEVIEEEALNEEEIDYVSKLFDVYKNEIYKHNKL